MPRVMMRVLMLSLLMGWLWPAAGVRAEPAESDVQWYVLTLRGEPAGWARLSERRADGRIITDHRVKIAMARGAQTIEVTMRGRFVETIEGEPIEAASEQDLGAMSKSTVVRFTEEGLRVTYKQGGRERSEKRPAFDGDWLTPAAAARYVEKKLEAGAEKITYRSFDPMAGMEPIEATMVVGEKQAIEVFGKTVPATKVTTTLSIAPGMASVGYVDEAGVPLKVEMKMGFMKMTMLAADERLAKAQVSPPELLMSTLVEPEREIEKPRELRASKYRLRLTGDGGAKLPDLEDAGYQLYERSADGRSATVTVDLDKAVKQGAAAPKVTHSMAIDGRDPKIGELVNKATTDLGTDASATARAEAMRRYVFEYVDAKTLDVGLASASEVAETGRGDCTEHAVLLAGMLRAAGVPSRTASGLIYVDEALGRKNVFGYHMWTQAWLDGRWVDLDATLGPGTPFDAAHIALSYSAMADGEQLNDMVDLVPVFGRLTVEPLQ